MGALRVSNGAERLLKWFARLKKDSSMFQGSFWGVSRACQRCSEKVFGVF